MFISFGQGVFLLLVGFILFGNLPGKLRQFSSFSRSFRKGGFFFSKKRMHPLCFIKVFFFKGNSSTGRTSVSKAVG